MGGTQRTRRRKRTIAIGMATAAVALLGGCLPQPWRSELVSRNADGTDSGDDFSRDFQFSPDGTRIAFVSRASNLGPTDANGADDIYLRDLATGGITLVSAKADGTASGDGGVPDRFFSFSPDGTKIAFASNANDLVPADSPRDFGTPVDHLFDIDVFVRDLTTGTTTLVSTDADGTDSGNHYSINPVFSPDGTKVAFVSQANDLGPTDSPRPGGGGLFFPDGDIYVRDLTTGTTALVTADADGTDSADRPTNSHPVWSPDGTRIAFTTEADDLGPADPARRSGDLDLYIRDLAAGTTSLVSANAAGTASGDEPTNELLPAFSPDGIRIAFTSQATDLSTRDSVAAGGLYVRDLAAGTTDYVAIDTDGRGTVGHDPEFSPDGTAVLFTSAVGDLGPVDTNEREDIYIRDLAHGANRLVSVTAGGDTGRFGSFDGAFGPGGDRVAFVSYDSGFGPLDRNGTLDIYVRDLPTDVVTLVTTDAGGIESADQASGGFGFGVSPDGTRIAFTSHATNFGPDDTNLQPDVYLASFHAADLALTGRAEPEPVAPGATLTYRLDLSNAGPDPADDVRVAILLPEGTTFASARIGESGEGEACPAPTAASPRLVVCDLGAVAPDEARTVTVEATVDAPAGASLQAVALAATPTAEDGPGENLTVVDSTVG